MGQERHVTRARVRVRVKSNENHTVTPTRLLQKVDAVGFRKQCKLGNKNPPLWGECLEETATDVNTSGSFLIFKLHLNAAFTFGPELSVLFWFCLNNPEKIITQTCFSHPFCEGLWPLLALHILQPAYSPLISSEAQTLWLQLLRRQTIIVTT